MGLELYIPHILSEHRSDCSLQQVCVNVDVEAMHPHTMQQFMWQAKLVGVAHFCHGIRPTLDTVV